MLFAQSSGTTGISPELLTAIAGVILSLFFSYVPGVSARWDKQEATVKRLVMVAALAASSLGIVGLSCVGWFDPLVTCDQAGAEQIIGSFLLALIANQSAFLITKG